VTKIYFMEKGREGRRAGKKDKTGRSCDGEPVWTYELHGRKKLWQAVFPGRPVPAEPFPPG